MATIKPREHEQNNLPEYKTFFYRKWLRIFCPTEDPPRTPPPDATLAASGHWSSKRRLTDPLRFRKGRDSSGYGSESSGASRRLVTKATILPNRRRGCETLVVESVATAVVTVV